MLLRLWGLPEELALVSWITSSRAQGAPQITHGIVSLPRFTHSKASLASLALSDLKYTLFSGTCDPGH